MRQPLNPVDIRYGDTLFFKHRTPNGGPTITPGKSAQAVSIPDRGLPRTYSLLFVANSDFPLDVDHHGQNGKLILWLGVGSTAVQVELPTAFPYAGQPVIYQPPLIPANTVQAFWTFETETTEVREVEYAFNVSIIMAPIHVDASEERGWGGGF